MLVLGRVYVASTLLVCCALMLQQATCQTKPCTDTAVSCREQTVTGQCMEQFTEGGVSNTSSVFGCRATCGVCDGGIQSQVCDESIVGYTYIAHADHVGDTIAAFTGASYLKYIQAEHACTDDPACKGFNNLGETKRNVTASRSGGVCLYIKNAADACQDLSPACKAQTWSSQGRCEPGVEDDRLSLRFVLCRASCGQCGGGALSNVCPPLEGFSGYPDIDSPGGNWTFESEYKSVSGLKPSRIREACFNSSSCVAFNSHGYTRTTAAPVARNLGVCLYVRAGAEGSFGLSISPPPVARTPPTPPSPRPPPVSLSSAQNGSQSAIAAGVAAGAGAVIVGVAAFMYWHRVRATSQHAEVLGPKADGVQASLDQWEANRADARPGGAAAAAAAARSHAGGTYDTAVKPGDQHSSSGQHTIRVFTDSPPSSELTRVTQPEELHPAPLTLGSRIAGANERGVVTREAPQAPVVVVPRQAAGAGSSAGSGVGAGSGAGASAGSGVGLVGEFISFVPQLGSCVSLAKSILAASAQVQDSFHRMHYLLDSVQCMLPWLLELDHMLRDAGGEAMSLLARRQVDLDRMLGQLERVFRELNEAVERWSARIKSPIKSLLLWLTAGDLAGEIEHLARRMAIGERGLMVALQVLGMRMIGGLHTRCGSEPLACRTSGAGALSVPSQQPARVMNAAIAPMGREEEHELRLELEAGLEQELADLVAGKADELERLPTPEREDLARVLLERGVGLNDLKLTRTAPSPALGNAVPMIRWADINEGMEQRMRLGSGGFGDVYASTLNGVPVAVKVYKPLDLTDTAACTQLARALRHEAYVMSLVRHPHVVHVMGTVVEPHTGNYALVMELHGTTLAALLRNEVLGEGTKLELARQVAEGMHVLHALPKRRVVHGDLKPSNILIAYGGAENEKYRALVADFGTARLDTSCMSGTTMLLTTPGTSAFSPMYCAPEVLLASQRPTTAADVYSYGLMLVEMFTGQAPWHAVVAGLNRDLAYEAIKHHLRAGAIPPLSGLPTALHPLVSACLRQDSASRPSFSEVVAQLQQLQADR